MLTRKHQAVIGSVVVVLAGVLGGASPAQAAAAPAGADGTAIAHAAAAGGTAPACIKRSFVNNPDGGMQSWPYNNCGKTMRIRIIVKNWRDTSCQSIPNKQSRYFRTVGGSYGRTAVC
ncbi:hypothetical protein [Streptomyces iconiensis]|uniref:Uncharacterized protein n=1 Tax=Streptomyces iconiensis TaxID=1384038 RepID=A0ABT7AAW1_9ACTN|nr:hypothetical protein [Streptomyces iconiensis]MDJ1138464.1 hypothetical protein [Streptomyces iconiensis]